MEVRSSHLIASQKLESDCSLKMMTLSCNYQLFITSILILKNLAANRIQDFVVCINILLILIEL